MNYGPPQSDSEDEYDGFYFGDDIIKKEPRSFWVTDTDQDLYDVVSAGDLLQIKKQVEMLQFDVNRSIKGGYTILMHACMNGHLNVVQYLVNEMNANVNTQVDSVTPLMQACACTVENLTTNVEAIVQLLIKKGAVVNVSDKYGTTPFMLACKNGYTNIVKLLINNASFDACDNQGCTPLFHAIENNHPDIVKLLVEAGVDVTIPNSKGYTPIQVAQFHGFYDMLEILPREKTQSYFVPSTFLTYNTLRDYIPRIFLKSECPEYFQEISSLLFSIEMDAFLEYFAKERISLAQFLVMDDEELKSVGIQYPIQRMKILKGLLDFHLHHWSVKTIARVRKHSNENLYEILMLSANHLQNLVIINATLRFLRKNYTSGHFGSLSTDTIHGMQKNLKSYQAVIRDLHKTTKYLQSFSPSKSPIYIDYNEIVAERKNTKVRRYFKYTTLFIGISVFICLKAKKIF